MNTHPDGLRRRGDKELTADQKRAYLALVTADVTTETKVEFPKMAPLYWEDWEDKNPALYVRASMSIPFFFNPLKVDGVPQGDEAETNWELLASYTGRLPTTCMFVDGGIMSNFPINIFHNTRGLPTAPTFGVKLGTERRGPRNIDKPMGLVGAIFDAARHCLDFDFIANNPDYRQLVACVDTKEHNWLNFEMGVDEKVELFLKGARAATHFLLKFNWEEYKEIRRHIAEAYQVEP